MDSNFDREVEIICPDCLGYINIFDREKLIEHLEVCTITIDRLKDVGLINAEEYNELKFILKE